MKPVCVSCQRFFRIKNSGFYFIEGMPAGKHRPRPGTSEADQWVPYKIWVGDKWECEGCGAVILNGFGSAPIAEHYQADFRQHVTALHADQLQVNDC